MYDHDYILKQYHRITGEPILFTASIAETVAGSCIYEPNKTCSANSTHAVSLQYDYGRSVTYDWEVEGPADSFTGQGTNAAVITTDNDSTVGFSSTCTVTMGSRTQVVSLYGEHTRTLAETDIAYEGEVV